MAVTVLAGGLLACSFAGADEEPAAAKKIADKKPAAAEAKQADKKVDAPKEKPVGKKTEAKPKDAEAKKKAPANPLSNFIRNIFGGKKSVPAADPLVGTLIPADAADGKKPAGNGDTTARDHIDSRAPFDTRQASRLRKARALIKSAQYKQAAQWLQRVLDTVDDEEDSVVRLANGQLESVGWQANRLLGQFPPAALENYRREHGDLAKQLLLEAREADNPAGIAEVADKYFHTTAGQDAANSLGTQHIDRGEFGPAARRFLQLIEADAPISRALPWQLKAAVAFREAGMVDGLKQLRRKLSASAIDSLTIGGRNVQPNTWLDGLGAIAQATPPRLDEWRMIYGSPQRNGTAIGGDPLLLERWRSPLTYNRAISEQVDILLEDLADQSRAAISAWHPLTVGNKVIFRTMRGVQVIDADTGKTLWETRAGISPERLLTGQPLQQYGAQSAQVMQIQFRNGILSNYRSNSVDQNPLTSLLFRDGIYGTLSSQDDKLFVIEDHAVMSQQQPGYYWGSRRNQNDAYQRDWSSNKLTAYNLESGRPLWEIGGRNTREPIQLPLAGTYFFGAPTPDGQELFAVGEKDNEIRLFSLDPKTGKSNWSQLLAVSESKIDEDFGRRWWNAQVAVGNGVIVCPTTVGWLVAIDRTSHAILWAYRYSSPQKQGTRNRFGGRQISAVANSTVGQRWCPSAPVIVGNRVLYTPAEFTDFNSNQSAIVCLNLSDGKRLWQKPKGTNRYLAGVFDDRVVVVGTSAIYAMSLKNGAVLWNRPIPTTDGNPSGFGVAVGNRYHLPLSSGQLWTIDLTKGEVAAKSFLADGLNRLGNLAMHRGMLISLSPAGLISFEQREAIVAEIRRRKDRNPRDPWPLMREADIHVLNREYEPALALLKAVPAEQIESDQQPHYRKQMIACITEIVRADFQNRGRELQELADFVQQPEETLHARRLAAEQLESLKQHKAAFAIYSALAAEESGQSVNRSGKSKVTLPLDRWIAGRMGDLWAQMDEEARRESGADIAVAAKALGNDPVALERFVSLYDFHPQGRFVRQRLADLYSQRGELSNAQIHLMHLARSADEKVAANSLYTLARLMDDQKLTTDAHFYYKQLSERHADVEVAEGTTAGALYEKLQADGLAKSVNDADRVSWGNYDLKIERTGASYSSSQKYELKSGAFRMPYFRQFRFEIDSKQKLAIIKLTDEKLHWLVPLRGRSRSSQSYAVAQAVGHRLFVLHRDVLHCLSPVERKVLWTKTLETRSQASGYYYSPNQQTARPMQSGQSILSGQALTQRNAQTGMLAVANSKYVCVYGRRKFTVLDAATGDIRWTRGHVPAYTKLVGNEDVLYMVPQNHNEAVAFRATDGKPITVENVDALLAKAIRISERGLVLVNSRSSSSILGLSSSSLTVVHQFDPLTKKTHWKHSFPNGAYFTIIDGNQLAALRKDGTFALLDLENGRLSELGKLDSGELKSRSGIYVIADHDNVYLMANKTMRSGKNFSLGLPFVRMNGTVFAFDRRNGKRLWKQAVTNQNLVLSQFAHSPVMTFAMRSYVRKGQLNHWTLDVVAIDKITGRKLIDTKSPFNSSFRSADVNLADRYIEMRSYNSRIRLIAIDRKTTKITTPAKAD
jgi:outer membrane protein assembly factor BamB